MEKQKDKKAWIPSKLWSAVEPTANGYLVKGTEEK